ncbi:MAG: PAS domain-containing protein, partial [Candidatus Heimdallarchaeota archaeon]
MPKNSNPQKQNEQQPKNLPENIKAAFNDLGLVQFSESFEEILTIRISLLDNNDELLYTTDNTEEVIGYTFDDFKLLAAFGFIHPDDRSEVISTFKNLNENGISESIIYRIFKFSGEQRWIRGISQQFLDENTGKQAGLLIVEFDVTDQIRKLDIVNTQEESFYKSLLELMQTPLLYLMNNN